MLNILTVTALLAGLGLRLYLAYAFHGNYDQESFDLVAAIFERGANVYQETSRYNYTPLWGYFLLCLKKFSDFTNLPFHFVSRGFLSLVDTANAVVIGHIFRILRGQPARKAFSIYMINPAAILLVGYHGQFETLALLPLLLATLVLVKNQLGNHTTLWVWMLGTASLITKHITVFSVWMLFHYLRSKLNAATWMALSVLIFVATFFPFFAEGGQGILENVFLYHGYQVWGTQLFFRQPAALAIFLLIMGILPWISKRLKLSAAQSMEFSTVALIALITGFGEQYLLLPVTFGTIFLSSWYWIYSAAIALFLAGHPKNINILHLPLYRDIIWLAAFGWFLSYFLQRKRIPPTQSQHSV